MQWERFARHRCDLAAKESGLECACVNNDNFTVLVSGGGRRHWVTMCTVWSSHSKWLQWICIKFRVKLEHSSKKTIWMIQKSTAIGNWWLAASSRQCTRSCIASCAKLFGETSNHPGDSAPLQSRFGTLRILTFPKTKITFERQEILDCWWDSGKYNIAADGNWENCVRSQGA